MYLFVQHTAFEIHLYYCMYLLFVLFLRLLSHCMNICNWFIPSSINRHWGCAHFYGHIFFFLSQHLEVELFHDAVVECLTFEETQKQCAKWVYQLARPPAMYEFQVFQFLTNNRHYQSFEFWSFWWIWVVSHCAFLLFPWWLMILSNFIGTFYPFVHLLRSVYSSLVLFVIEL